MTKAISIRLPSELIDRLDNLVQDTERSRAFIIQKALDLYLEEAADLQVALDRLNDQTDSIISGKELRKDLGL